MHFFVTGGAGFIGSSMVDHLLKNGHQVTAYDNFSTGRKEFLNEANQNKNFKLIVGDLLDTALLKNSMKEIDFVFHFAANADVRFGLNHPDKDLQQNIVATFNVLESMRANGVKKIGFSSTGSVYGESAVIPTPENAPFPIQTSLYASSKLAGEAYISSYCEGFGMQAWIFRFVSILGERYTHGHVFDFYKKLKKDPTLLNVLGNGKQRKSYLYIGDCLDAILISLKSFNEKINIVNLGTDEYVEVNNSIDIITQSLNMKPEIVYAGGERGWVGDNPFIFLDTQKIRSTGWKPKLTISEGISKTLDYLVSNEYLIEERTN